MGLPGGDELPGSCFMPESWQKRTKNPDRMEIGENSIYFAEIEKGVIEIGGQKLYLIIRARNKRREEKQENLR